MTPRRERTLFVCAAAFLWLVFLVQAWNTPVLLDDWYQLTYWRTHDFGPAAIWEYGRFNYFHYNPRIGDVFLAIVNGPRAAHLIITPLVQLAVLPITFAIAFARWPRPTSRDLQLLLFLQVMIWLVIPIPGVIYFYRPFCTNYLWAFTITCTLFVPYRFALAHSATRAKPWLVPLMFALGWVAGMCNEHTGPTAMVAIAVFVYIAKRRGQLRAWMLAGLVGLWIGYPMLFLAPGQAVRYAGLATRDTPLHVIRERGLDGCFEIVLDFIGEAQLGIVFFTVLVLLHTRARRQRGERVVSLSTTTLATSTLLVLAAGAILVTLFASPTATERLFYASSILFVAALAAIVERLIDEPGVRRFLTITCVAIFAYHVFRFVQVYVIVKGENDNRIALLRAAPPASTVIVPPYGLERRTRWHWGDDFRYASLREYVANEVFDLHAIEYTEHLRWAQPPTTDRYEATRVYDPPLAPAAAANLAPVRYIPTYWEWTLVQFRRLLVTTPIADYEGHKLVRYTVSAHDTGFDDPKHRPILVVDWTPAAGFTFVDGRPYDDRVGRPHIRIWKDSMPAVVDGAYVHSCGSTKRVALVPDDDGVGPTLPLAVDCRGVHTAYVCERERCWQAGRYWR